MKKVSINCITGVVILIFIISSPLYAVNNLDQVITKNQQAAFDSFLDSLNHENITTYNKANEIRKYVAQNLNRGVPKDSVSLLYSNMSYDSISPFECLQLLQQDKIRGNCGLASYMLAKLYDYAGIKAFIYDCGFDGTRFTHQFTLIELDNKLFVEDAHYNITFNDSLNAPKDFYQLLTELKANDFSNIKIVQDEFIKIYWADSRTAIDSVLKNPEFDKTNVENISEISEENGRYKITMQMNFEAIVKKRFSKILPLLQKEGLPENFLSIYLKPLHIVSASTGIENTELKKKINNLRL